MRNIMDINIPDSIPTEIINGLPYVNKGKGS